MSVKTCWASTNCRFFAAFLKVTRPMVSAIKMKFPTLQSHIIWGIAEPNLTTGANYSCLSIKVYLRWPTRNRLQTKKKCCKQKRNAASKKETLQTKKKHCKQKRNAANKKGTLQTKKECCKQKRNAANKKEALQIKKGSAANIKKGMPQIKKRNAANKKE